MHCYCFNQFVKTKSYDVSFSEFKKVDIVTDGEQTIATEQEKGDDQLYCKDWLKNYGFQNLAVIGTSLVAVGINIIATTVLTLSVQIEESHTVNDETMGMFQKLTIFQWINIGVIILIININLVDTDEKGNQNLFLGFLPIFNGQFEDFNSEWYGQIGKTICLTLLMNIFTPHISKLSIPFLKIFFRFNDRSWTQ